MSSVTVNTNGQNLVVFSSSAALYTTQANAAAATSAVTLPQTITAATTYYYPDATQASVTLVVKQVDGTILFNTPIDVGGGAGPSVLNPAPDRFQLASDVFGGGGHTLAVSAAYIGAPQSIAVTATAVGNGVQYFVPVWVPRLLSLDQLAVNVTIVGGTGSLMRLGIYNDTGAHVPGTVLLDAGTVATESGTGLKSITIDQSLTPGLWWFSGCQQGVPSPNATVSTAFLATASSTAGALTQTISCRYKTGVTGAFATASALSAADGVAGIKVLGRVV